MLIMEWNPALEVGIDEMDKELDEAEADSQVRVLLITGSVAKAFVAGADSK